ncbi:unnamed protein product [Lampetra planeri]
MDTERDTKRDRDSGRPLSTRGAGGAWQLPGTRVGSPALLSLTPETPCVLLRPWGREASGSLEVQICAVRAVDKRKHVPGPAPAMAESGLD